MRRRAYAGVAGRSNLRAFPWHGEEAAGCRAARRVANLARASADTTRDPGAHLMSDSRPASESPAAASDREARYRALIAMEGDHAGQPDPKSPQLWEDPVLQDLVLAGPWNDLVDRAVASGGPALELGCGDGDLSLELAARGVAITGVDLSEMRVARGNAEAARRGLAERASFRAADLNTIELEPGRWRTILAHQALHHVLEIDRLLAQVEGALAEDGVLLVNDYRGAGRVEKLMSALAVGVLPASWSYAD